MDFEDIKMGAFASARLESRNELLVLSSLRSAAIQRLKAKRQSWRGVDQRITVLLDETEAIS
jgi:hypothetical protein